MRIAESGLIPENAIARLVCKLLWTALWIPWLSDDVNPAIGAQRQLMARGRPRRPAAHVRQHENPFPIGRVVNQRRPYPVRVPDVDGQVFSVGGEAGGVRVSRRGLLKKQLRARAIGTHGP